MHRRRQGGGKGRKERRSRSRGEQFTCWARFAQPGWQGRVMPAQRSGNRGNGEAEGLANAWAAVASLSKACPRLAGWPSAQAHDQAGERDGAGGRAPAVAPLTTATAAATAAPTAAPAGSPPHALRPLGPGLGGVQVDCRRSEGQGTGQDSGAARLSARNKQPRNMCTWPAPAPAAAEPQPQQRDV